MPSNYSVTLIQNKKAFKDLKSEWNELLAQSDSDTIFLTWEWLYTWWSVYKANYRLFLLTIRDEDNKLIAIGPFKIALRKALPGFLRHAIVEFIGDAEDVIPEYLDVIIHCGCEKVASRIIADYLLNSNHIDLVNLKPIRSSSIFSKILKERFANYRFPTVDQIYSKCPVAHLPDTWNEFLLSRSRNFRKKSKEYLRVCKRDLDFHMLSTTSRDQLPSSMRDLAALHRKRWKDTGKSKSFKSNQYTKFHSMIAHRFLDNGWLRLMFLLDEETPIAAIYCFLYGHQYYFYQSGRNTAYDKYRVGFVLMNMAIRRAISEKAVLFDFLTGEEEYKYRWADDVRISRQFLGCKGAYAYFCSSLNKIPGLIKRHLFQLRTL